MMAQIVIAMRMITIKEAEMATGLSPVVVAVGILTAPACIKNANRLYGGAR